MKLKITVVESTPAAVLTISESVRSGEQIVHIEHGKTIDVEGTDIRIMGKDSRPHTDQEKELQKEVVKHEKEAAKKGTYA